MIRKTFARTAAFAAVSLLTAGLILAQAPPATLTIQADQPVSKVSPTLYGLMTEEINFSYDGGLYAEMVRNRTFRGSWRGIDDWFVVEGGNAQASINVDDQTGPSEALKHSLRLEVKQADLQNQAGVLNDGYWGMALRPNTTYKGSFYAKAGSGDLGAVTVSHSVGVAIGPVGVGVGPVGVIVGVDVIGLNTLKGASDVSIVNAIPL